MRILLFDWYSGGHHEHYLAAFTRALAEQHEVVVAAPAAGAAAAAAAGAEPLPLESSFPLSDASSRFGHARGAALRAEVGVLRKAIAETRPDHALHLFADGALRALAGRHVGAPLSLLLFRPRAHIPQAAAARSRRELVVAHAYELAVRAWRRSPGAYAVLTLDPLAASAWSRRGGAPVYAIPEPPVSAPVPMARERHGIAVFGRLSARKGLHYLVDALEHDGAGVQLVLAGAAAPGFELELDRFAERLRAAGVEAEVCARLHDEAQGLEVLAGVRAAVLPYVGHIGMSRVLLEAAAVGTPVVAHADGLVGYLVATRGLGLAVDCRDPAALAAAVRTLSEDPRAADRYAEALQRFAADHSPERFAAAVGEPFAPGRENLPSNWRIRPVRGS